MRRTAYPIGDTKVAHIRLVGQGVDAAAAPADSGGFWASASTGEKVVIVGAGIGAVALLVLAMRSGGRRRGRR